MNVSKVHAEIIFSNMSAGSDGSDAVADAADLGQGPLAQSFSTGSSGLDLASLDLLLSAATPGDSGSLVVSLMSDADTSPSGSVLATLGTIQDSALPTAPSIYALTLSQPVALSAGTRYWIELTGTGSSAEWSWSYDTSGTGVASEYTFNNYNGPNGAGVADSSNGLYQMCVGDTAGDCPPASQTIASSSTTSLPSPPSSPPSDDPPAAPTPPPPVQPVNVTDTSAPEPGTLGVFAMALAGLAVMRRRSMRQRADTAPA